MTESKHTPGPWQRMGQSIHAPDGRLLMQASYGRRSVSMRVPNEETDTNLALAAAAPEMAEALQSVSTALSAAYLAAKGNLNNGDRYEAMGMVEDAGKMVRAALEKARVKG